VFSCELQYTLMAFECVW